MLRRLLEKAFRRSVAAAKASGVLDPSVAAVVDAERAIKALNAARADDALRERLAKCSNLRGEHRDLVFKCAPAARPAVVAALEQLNKSDGELIIFKELGHSGPGSSVAVSAYEELSATAAAKAEQISKSGTRMTREQVIAKTLKANPALYRELRAERRRERGEPW